MYRYESDNWVFKHPMNMRRQRDRAEQLIRENVLPALAASGECRGIPQWLGSQWARYGRDGAEADRPLCGYRHKRPTVETWV
jgi:hypothetical protein